jgi:hypothetical protein
MLSTHLRANVVASAVLLALFASSSLPAVAPAAAAIASLDLKGNSPAVSAAISSLREAATTPNSREDLFKSFQSIADIITEGKGVGGSINYRGVQLERGYVADEDTTIYNPGLTLLTESEKSQLVQAIVESRASALARDGAWSDDNQLAYEFLKDKLDPFHITELRGYLTAFPVLVGVAYAVNLAVQQLARRWFPISYGLGVAIVVLPALALLALGPPS